MSDSASSAASEQPPHHQPAVASTSKKSEPPPRLVSPEDLVTDQALQDANDDRFHHTAIAKAVADLALSSVTPVNIALFGPWGSGKSTFHHLMKTRVAEQSGSKAVVSYYDAWKYGGQALKRNFIQEIATQHDIKNKSDFDRDLLLNQEQSRLRLGRWLKYNLWSIAGALLIGLIAGSLWVVAHSAIDAQWLRTGKTFWSTFKTVLPDHVSEFGLVLAAVLAALLLGPKALESAVVKTTRPAADRDDQFSRMFHKLVEQVKKEKKTDRLIFFIDELDRCEPDDVVATLVDLKTFLDEADCVFVVAADRDVLEEALKRVPQAKPVREDDPYYSTPGAFIDKIFQHQIALPPLRSHALSSFAHDLVNDRTTGLWHELRNSDDTGRRFDDVVYILIPAHVASPRRAKVLLNNFATNARIAQSRNIDWTERARELAFLTVLETEFSAVAAALVRFPNLLTHLRSTNEPPDTLSVERRATITRFKNPITANDSVAGTVLEDQDAANAAKAQAARKLLAQQLHDYLGKLTVVTDLHDPRPDLLYLRVVGYDEGLTDPVLGEMIDLAAEREPDAFIAAFADQTDHIKTVAARLLIRSLASQRGIGQANVLEAACRLIQDLPDDRVDELAPLAPEVLVHVPSTTMRPNTIPGAVALAAAEAPDNAAISPLLDLLTAASDQERLLCTLIPTAQRMDTENADAVFTRISELVPNTREPLRRAVTDLPGALGARAWTKSEEAVKQVYASGATTRLTVFNELTDAATSAPEPSPLLWNVLYQALRAHTTTPDLLAVTYERRDELLPLLDAEHRTRVALYAFDVDDATHRSDWIQHIAEAPTPTTDTVSKWARDAINVVTEDFPASDEDLSDHIDPFVALLHDTDRANAYDHLVEQVPAVTWGNTADPDGRRWANLKHAAEVLDPEAKRTELRAAIAASLTASITTFLPSATAAPEAISDDWRAQIRDLDKAAAKTLDAALSDVNTVTQAADIQRLRLRIAARSVAKMSALAPGLLTPLAAATGANTLAAEWLTLVPGNKAVATVHSVMPAGTAAMTNYAAKITVDRRTTLWVDLEHDGAINNYLRAVGVHGVSGAAIEHIAAQVKAAARQSQRDKAVNTLLTAKFKEQPTDAEAQRGEAGHREATALALDLIKTTYNDDVILAARIVIHSGGCAYGKKGQLRDAFTTFANRKQKRNFTQQQITDLARLDLVRVTKRTPRWARLFFGE